MLFWVLCMLALILAAAALLIVRLWRRSSETHQMPERSLALFATVIVTGCFGWIVSAFFGGGLGAGVRFLISAVSEGLLTIGVAALFVGSWRFFRPTSRTSAAAAAMAVAALAAAWGSPVAEGRPIEPGAASLGAVVLSGGRAVALAWWGVECLLYFAQMKRRLALGLADVEQTERFGYLGLGTLLVSVALALVPFSGLVLGRLPREVPAVLAVIVSFAGIGVAGIVLGLLPGPWLANLPRLSRLGS